LFRIELEWRFISLSSFVIPRDELDRSLIPRGFVAETAGMEAPLIRTVSRHLSIQAR
jgi:hypothetical protein